MKTEPERIISWEHLEQRVTNGASFREPVNGIPTCEIFFDAHRGELGFAIEVETTELPTVEPVSITFSIVQKPYFALELRSSDELLYREFYDFCVEILDSVQLESLAPPRAVDAAWGAWVRLLDRKAILSKEKQLGLIGELWLLQRIGRHSGWAIALDAWHESSNSEHDFCFNKFDIEVKATTNESRVHLIGSAKQLHPSLNRPLYLLSHQFTSAARQAVNAISLTDLVEVICHELVSEKLIELFKTRLLTTGWRQEHSRHYEQSFVFRTAPTIIAVDDNCPRLTPPMLESLGQIVCDRLNSVTYRIDVTGLGYSDGSPEFLDLIP
jgi:hypothetical protein